MNGREFLSRFFYHLASAMAVLAGLGFLMERLAPASVVPFLPLPWMAVGSIILFLFLPSKRV